MLQECFPQTAVPYLLFSYAQIKRSKIVVLYTQPLKLNQNARGTFKIII